MAEQMAPPPEPTLPESNVTPISEAAALRKAVEAAAEEAAPHPPNGAIAQPSGDGGGPGASGESPSGEAAGKPKKPEKTVDFGVLNRMVGNFTLIYPTDTAWDAEKRVMVKISNMAHAYGTDYVRMWKQHEWRRMVDLKNVVFDPSMSHDEETMINIYDPAEMVEAVEGDVEPFWALLRHLLSELSDNADEVDEFLHWVVCWIAYQIQNPGVKMKTALVFHGEEGSGKSLIAEAMAAMFGPYAVTVGQDELEDKFNDWRSGKRFVIADEVSTRAEMVHNKNRIKPMITGDTVQINPKNMPRREERNTMHFVFLSNELQPLALDNTDRRFFVVWTPRAREREFYRRFGDWLRSGGVSHLHYCLKNYPLEGFDPYAPAPITQAKTNLIGLNRKSPESFWLEWANGELDLPYRSCSMPQVYRAYLKWCVRTGDRYPFKREQFTPTVCRFSESQGRPACVKPMKLESEGAKKVERMFLVCDPDEAIAKIYDETGMPMTQGAWATDCVKTFEPDLRTYLGWSKDGKPPSPGGSSVGEGEGE